MSDLKLYRNAKVQVEVKDKGNNKGKEVYATINDEKQHIFDKDSRVSKSLALITPEELQGRLDGGYYFFKGDGLVDYRQSDYNGFIHDDNSIQALEDVIGYEGKDGKKCTQESMFVRMRSGSIRNQQSSVMLGADWSEQEITVPELGDGGKFRSILHFLWNPFFRNVRTELLIERLVCNNGMVGFANFFNANIPLVNKWEEHLEIANCQIQNKVESKFSNRINEMSRARASVADMQTILRHAEERLDNKNITPKEFITLSNICKIANPLYHLSDVYQTKVFGNSDLASRLPSHMTQFDAWNMATEIDSHTSATSTSTSQALQKLANSLMFFAKNIDENIAKYIKPEQSSFSDPDVAFFGEEK